MSWYLCIEDKPCAFMWTLGPAAIVDKLGFGLHFLSFCLGPLNLGFALFCFSWISTSRFYLAVNGFTFKFLCHSLYEFKYCLLSGSLMPAPSIGMSLLNHADMLTWTPPCCHLGWVWSADSPQLFAPSGLASAKENLLIWVMSPGVVCSW